MAYVTVPKDLSKVKNKVFGNLTKRQLLCYGAAILLGVPLFILLKGINTSVAAMGMIIVSFPFFMLSMYEKNGQPMEKVLRNYIEVRYLRPRHRPYQTDNFYTMLKRQQRLDKEVQLIVNQKQKTSKSNPKNQADTRRKKTDPKRH